MLRKPWPLVILALLHFIAPVLNTVVSAYLSKQDISTFIRSFNSTMELIAFFAFFPIAGLAIYSVKKWSYPVFLGVLGWSFYFNYQTWMEFPNQIPLPLLAAVYLINVGVVTYFLIPAVREVYFNRSIRWWESKPRYQIDLEGTYEGSSGIGKCLVSNISEGGVFLTIPDGKPAEGEGVTVTLRFFGLELNVTGRVVYKVSSNNGYGIQFVRPTSVMHRKVRRLIRALDLLEVPRRPEKISKIKNFFEWTGQFLQTGKGLVPDLPPHVLAARAAKKSEANQKKHAS